MWPGLLAVMGGAEKKTGLEGLCILLPIQGAERPSIEESAHPFVL
jgi:hypothetical protein